MSDYDDGNDDGDDDDCDDDDENDANSCLMMSVTNSFVGNMANFFTSCGSDGDDEEEEEQDDDNDDEGKDDEEEEDEEEDDDDEEDPSQRPTIPAWSGQLRLPEKRRSGTGALQTKMPLVHCHLYYCHWWHTARYNATSSKYCTVRIITSSGR